MVALAKPRLCTGIFWAISKWNSTWIFCLKKDCLLMTTNQLRQTPMFKTSEKGLRFLQTYNRLDNLLREGEVNAVWLVITSIDRAHIIKDEDFFEICIMFFICHLPFAGFLSLDSLFMKTYNVYYSILCPVWILSSLIQRGLPVSF